MAFEPDFLTMMPHTIVRERWLRRDFDGANIYETDPVTGDPVLYTYRARVVGKGLALRRREGEEDAIIVDIYIYDRGDLFRMQDRITLPPTEEWIDDTPEIFAVGRYPDEDGHHHTKVQCGWMYHRQGQ